MNGFLYFVPELVDAPDAEALAAMGIGYVFDEPARCSLLGRGTGPHGLSGALLGATNDLTLHHAMEWTELRGATRKVLIGAAPGRIPPGALARDKQLHPAAAVVMGDGQTWILPVAIAFSGDGFVNAVPHSLGRGADGKWARNKPAARYARLAEKAEGFFNWWVSGLAAGKQRGEIEQGSVVELVVEALTVHYRVSDDEVERLGLLDEVSLVAAAKAIIDVPVFEEEIKKKRPAPT